MILRPIERPMIDTEALHKRAEGWLPRVANAAVYKRLIGDLNNALLAAERLIEEQARELRAYDRGDES